MARANARVCFGSEQCTNDACLCAGAVGDGAAGDVQLHPEPPPGGGRPQRPPLPAARHLRSHHGAGHHHPQPAPVDAAISARGHRIAHL
jgi:hypothetical protein